MCPFFHTDNYLCKKIHMKNITLLDRIKKIVDYEGVSVRSFEKKINATQGVISKAIKNDTDIKGSLLLSIVENYTHISAVWLLTGKGDMLLSSEEKALKQLTPCVSPELGLGVPYYDVDFSGGFNAIFNNQTLLPDHNIVFAPFKDAQLWCNVTGNSMAEKINHGDIIALKELPNWEENVLFGEIYAVVTDHLRTIKIIRKSEDINNYKLVPINKGEFDENEVKKTSILRVFEVLGAIKKFF